MSKPKASGFSFGEFAIALLIEGPIGALIGLHHPIWEDPPEVIALWVGGFALLFVVIYKIAARRDALSDFLATGRKTMHRKYPQERRATTSPRSETPSNAPPTKQ